MVTIIIIITTSIVSYTAFQRNELFYKLQFNAYQVYHRKQYYRLFTHALVHVSWPHLLVNMLVLFFFGPNVEKYFSYLAAQGILRHPILLYLFFYILAVVFSSSISLAKHKDNIYYNAVGASGAVSAILFFWIFFNPWETLRFYAILPIPAIIFGVGYVVYSHYMSKRNIDNVGHDAHLLGAVFGFVFPLFIDLGLIQVFVSQFLNR